MSVLLDTNVLSELMRARPAEPVVRWVASRARDDLYVSAVTQAEMLLGARILPAGKRQRALEAALRAMFDEDFAGRVLAFDAAAAPFYAEVVASRRSLGRPVAQFDAQIAAIARRHSIEVATRNLDDFSDCGVSAIDPWQA